MSGTPETSTNHDAQGEQDINAALVLSRWYGPDSVACHTLRVLDTNTAETQFVVGQNLCGPAARPPMFDRIVTESGVYTTQTSPEDAHQHFIDEVGIKVVPGHNITGLVVEAMTQEAQRTVDSSAAWYLTGYDFIRFKEFVLPGQRISFTGQVERADEALTFSPTMVGQSRPFARNFRLEATEPLDEDTRNRLLAQHWLFEINAQGLGMVALQQVSEGIVPVLMESGKSWFAKVPVKAGDIVTSRFTVLAADDKQVLGNAQDFVNDIPVCDQQRILLGLVPLEQIREAIAGAKT